MTSNSLRTRAGAWLRVIVALLGTLPLALLTSAGLARFLPLSRDARFAVGFVAAIPLWVTAMCLAFLARSGARASVLCVVVSMMMAALVYGVPH
ncbi:MAG: hypothetical protein QM756_09155 [Polyangiaceae bacterium]